MRRFLWNRGLAVVLTLSAATTFCGCTTVPRTPVTPPAPVVPVVPAECRTAAFESYPDTLGTLPDDFLLLAPGDQARTLLNLTLSDSLTYRSLRAQAMRCAQPSTPRTTP